MGNRIVLAAALAACSLALPAAAQEGSLFQKAPWVELEIVGSRLVVLNRGCGRQRTTIASSPEDDTRQTLSMQMQCSALVVSYEAESAGQHLSLDVNERGQLTLERHAAGSAAPSVCFCQSPAGRATLHLGGTPPRTYSADSFWHLMLAEPQACREHLTPLLETLRPAWRLGEQAVALESALLATAGRDLAPQHRAWQALVDDLGSGDFATRQAADRALREAGQGVLAFLARLDEHALDAEQRRRIRAIAAELRLRGPDTPQRVALWLVADKAAWLALLAREDVAVRTAAAEHLALLCHRSFSFDPHADGLQRQAQLQKLRARLVER